MDPYLEGYLWADVHHELATIIKRLLVPLVRPKYAVRIEVSRYALTLDYDQPPPEPALSEADAAWAAECVKKWRAVAPL